MGGVLYPFPRLPKPILLLLLLFIGQQGSGQAIIALKRGDKLPASIWQVQLKVLDHTGQLQTTTLSAYKGKLIILDFWATWCGTCIEQIPLLNNQQKSFNDKIAILMVTGDDSTRINRLTRRNELLENNRLPVLFSDSLFSALFPHRFLPHEVWINSSGVYLGATTEEFVNEKVIKEVLDGKSLPDDKKDLLNFNDTLTALHSEFSHFYKGKGWLGNNISSLRYGSKLIKGTQSDRYMVRNAPILQLYALAMNTQGFPFNPQRRVIKDSLLAEIDYTTADGYREIWGQTHSYWYELEMPVGTSDSVRRAWMLKDLNAAFQLNGHLAKVEDTVCLITFQKPTTRINTGGKLTLQQLIWQLEPLPTVPLIVNEATLETDARFSLPDQPEKLKWPALQSILKAQGLNLQKVRLPIEKFILTKL